MKKYLYKILAFLCVIALLTGCGAQGGSTSGSSSASGTNGAVAQTAEASQASITASPVSVTYSDEDKNGEWSQSDVTASIQLNGSSASADGAGVSVKGSTVTITAAGTYLITGSLTDGQIVIDAGKESTVRLILDGAVISCSSSAPIYAVQAKKTIITLAEGTKNSLTDGKSYTYADAEAEEPNAAVFAKDDLTINGSGTLSVTANFKNGITSKDNLVITGGTINVTAANDGLRGRDSVAIGGGALQITAGGDGIQSNNDEDTQKGWVSLDGGTIQITAENDGVQAETILQVSDGEYTIKTGGGSENAPAKQSQFNFPQGGMKRDDNSSASSDTDSIASATTRGTAVSGTGSGTAAAETVSAVETTSAETDSTTASAKGLKSGTGLFVTGGTITVDSSDDSVHSNGDISVTGGAMTLSSGDDGVHADSVLSVEDGTVDISRSYEGLEGNAIEIKGGTIHLTASDDGLNAAGGNDSFSTDRSDANPFNSDSSCLIRISGGLLFVDASGDGIDSNGALSIEGGTTIVEGTTGGGNGILDYGSSGTITGGILVGTGTADMLQIPGTDSSQNTLAVTYSSVQAAGTLLTLSDSDGSSLLSVNPAKEYQAVIISTPELKQGESYTLYTGGSVSGKTSDTLTLKGTYTAGTKVVTVPLSGVATSVDDSGNEVTTNAMGGMGGGMRGGKDGGTPPELPDGASMPEGMTPPDGTTPPELPDKGTMPERPNGQRKQKSDSTTSSSDTGVNA